MRGVLCGASSTRVVQRASEGHADWTGERASGAGEERSLGQVAALKSVISWHAHAALPLCAHVHSLQLTWARLALTCQQDVVGLVVGCVCNSAARCSADAHHPPSWHVQHPSPGVATDPLRHFESLSQQQPHKCLQCATQAACSTLSAASRLPSKTPAAAGSAAPSRVPDAACATTVAADTAGADAADGRVAAAWCTSASAGAAGGADSAPASCCLLLVLPLLRGRCTVAAGGGGGLQGASLAASAPSSWDKSYPTASFGAAGTVPAASSPTWAAVTPPAADGGPLLLPACGADVGVTGPAPP